MLWFLDTADRVSVTQEYEVMGMEMNLQKYLAFVKTVEYGSFTKAAEVLSYSQSGISRMIGDLEQEWGIVLLERGKKGVRLTSNGTRLYPFARGLCAEYEKLRAEVEELNGLQSGLIRIGTFSSVAICWLPKIIQKFQEDYPNIDYELLLGDYREIEEWILEGRVDCGFVPLPVTSKELDTELLGQDHMLAVLPLNHPLAKREVFPMEAFNDAPFMLLEKDNNTEVAELLEQHHVKPKVKFKTWDDHAIMSMVEKGLGISLLPELILEKVSYQIAVKPLDITVPRNIGIAMRDRQNASLTVKRFLDYIKYR